MLELSDDEWFDRLNKRRQAQSEEHATLWTYYDNEQPLSFIAKILEEQGDRFPPLRLNWSAVVVDSVEERLDIESLRVRGSDKPDEDLMRVWRKNDMDEASSEAHLAAMVTGLSFVIVGPGIAEGDDPIITVEYGDQVAVEIDPLTRQVVAAIKVWRSDTNTETEDSAILYLPGRFISYEFDEEWKVTGTHTQTSQTVPVVPMLNRPRRGRGRSELVNIIPIVDAVNQTATNMLAALEHHALPRRWAVNVAESDFTDAKGEPLKAWAIATGAVWAIPRAEDDGTGTQPQPSVGQFTGAALDNFHNSIRVLALQAASQYGLSSSKFGYAAENPASADAIRASESREIKRTERHQVPFGGTWERTAMIVLEMLGRDITETQVETVWRDAATPTKTAAAQAAMELVNAGIIDREQAREDIGLTLTQREAIAARATGLDVNTIINGLRNTSVKNPEPNPPADVHPAPVI